MKKIIILLTISLPTALHAQDRVLIEETLDAARVVVTGNERSAQEEDLLLDAGSRILFGELGEAPTSLIVDAFVTIAANGGDIEYREVRRTLTEAGRRGFAGAADGLYRVYDERRAAGKLRDLASVAWDLGQVSDGLTFLGRMATRDNADFGEADLRAGVREGPFDRLISVAGAGNAAMLQMSESPDGRDLLLELDGAGELSYISQRLIRYDEGGYGEEICEAVPELSVCVERELLGFDRGHPPMLDVCPSDEPEACDLQHQYHAELDECADEIEDGRTYVYKTADALSCRDQVIIRWRQRGGR